MENNGNDFPDFPSPSSIRFNLWSPKDNIWLSLLRELWHRCNVRRALAAASKAATSKAAASKAAACGDPPHDAQLSVNATMKSHRMSIAATPWFRYDTDFPACHNGGGMKGEHQRRRRATADVRDDSAREAVCADRALNASLAGAIREAQLHCRHPERTAEDSGSARSPETSGQLTLPVVPVTPAGPSVTGDEHLLSPVVQSPHAWDRGQAIPPLLHFVWLGGHRPPSFFDEVQQSWAVHNPDLIQALWTDAHVESLLDVLDRKVRSWMGATREASRQGLSGDRPETDASETIEWERTDGFSYMQTLAHGIKTFRKESCLAARSDIARLLILCHYGGHALIRFILRHVGRPFSKWGTHDVDQTAVALEIIKLQVARFSPEASDLLASLPGPDDEADNAIERTGPGLLTRATLLWLRDQLNSSSCSRCRQQERCSHNYEHKNNVIRAASGQAEVVGIETGSKEDDSEPDDANWACCALATTCIFPPIFFYPVPNHRRKDLLEGKVQAELLDSSFSYTVHHWRQTWQVSRPRGSETRC
ncbi:conserved hypothetical protein [Neospora caninum Liverpool]|uniref:Uncharacterized protein n=1 Tax=Neospora caninum (strain Liverpool) TaxID=572307 RepID=F0VEX9_NEOCL|nr:conserved hypothetical protein [Neospora caninum Liverpool]CBZ52273.1 conserved hypothetical protein [Neospora caninum Liverpool]|eukprot:XP_003882305.1 conserved hypothetical protein [Neospora caninum Liverpool]